MKARPAGRAFARSIGSVHRLVIRFPVDPFGIPETASRKILCSITGFSATELRFSGLEGRKPYQSTTWTVTGARPAEIMPMRWAAARDKSITRPRT
ncbi:hypothetical protein BLTE_29570 [Blastochloris tepida]|uniref:Uncharacterized protein n=1 Tax=Blastochloris tepida TaxID=2233851 RepID=A0A348G3Y9_9HYPH|nr:hypothetical protein BLTE_29570 [Blastochloris tepida]